ADLTEFRVTANMTHLFFLVKAVDVTDPGWSPRFGWSEPAVNIYIDQDPAAETGYNETWVPSSTFWGKYMPIDATLANVWWEYIVVLHGWNVSVWDSPTNFKANIVAVGDIDHNAIEAAVPFTVLGVTECPAGQIWRFVVLTGIISFEVFLEVKETAEQWAPGGGASDTTPYPDVECDAFDGAFYTSNENQYADWSDYDATTNQNTTLCNYPTDVPEGYVDLEFGEGEIVPEFPGGATVTLFGCAAALSVFVIIARKRFPHILEL
ncbi:MAG: glucodextranase DOMON-like domain-containing protein, partial [bacterium]